MMSDELTVAYMQAKADAAKKHEKRIAELRATIERLKKLDHANAAACASWHGEPCDCWKRKLEGE